MAEGLRELGGRYRLLQPLGQGGMGTVFAGVDLLLHRNVAIKMLRGGDSAQQELRDRFLREARAVASLSHPNIVNIWDVGVDNDELYIVMELLEGETLSTVLRTYGSRLPLSAAVRILLDVAEALRYAHGRGVVHRDIKPNNVILVTDGAAKITDFGIAKFASNSNAEMTQPGMIIGTPQYMAPEQIRGEMVDARADLFAFGALAFETISGVKAFAGDHPVAIMHKVLGEPAARLTGVVADCPRAIDDLVARCLERDRDERVQSADEIIPILRDVLATFDGAAKDDIGALIVAARPAPTPAIEAGTLAGPVLGNHTVERSVSVPPPHEAYAPTPPVPRRSARPGPRPVSAPLEPGTRVSRFVVHEMVARGQTGHLYKAYDPVRSRLVGLKVIDDRSGVAVNRLMRASRIWLDLHHDNLQTILEVDPGGPQAPALIVTELVEGVDLARLISQQKLDLAQKVEVVIQVCDAVDYMHRRGVVHREIKPRNIVLSRQLHVTLLDSGLARSTTMEDTSYTQVGVAVGDLTYMAPEQAQGRCDQRSDVYGLGAVLYELVMEETPQALGAARMVSRLQAIEHLPAKLITTMRLSLEEDPNRRLSSVREMADHLRALVPARRAPLNLSDVIVTLHGIRTHARWQRAFSEVATRAGLLCRLDRWNFGYFSVFRFLSPWSRQAKVSWFRSTYHDEFGDQPMAQLSTERPSVIAHSFGTYVLGNALLRYPYLRFNRVLLCGSILPTDFPWEAIIDRGQVQAVRNEYGARDVWTNAAPWFIPGTGPSGLSGFTCQHDRFEQERFDYSHSEYFERGHMEDRWLPYLKRRLSHITPRDRAVAPPPGGRPWGLFGLYAIGLIGLALLAWWVI
jgi:serine/threonine-protein kinase